MPSYSLHHIHHEAADVPAVVKFYESVFNATSDEPFVKDGAPWQFVHIGDVQITVTGREASDIELFRYKGLDHFCLATDDFDATMARTNDSRRASDETTATLRRLGRIWPRSRTEFKTTRTVRTGSCSPGAPSGFRTS